MKQITILQENVAPLTIDDNDETDMETYVKSLSSIMESNNVVFLHTTSCSMIIRPHKVTSVIVKNKHPIFEDKKKEVVELKEEANIHEESSNQDEDIIEEIVKD